ncbi:MAG TPA: hypothetical protein VFW15_15065 [Thermoanaerobaculia bacterium]|nr:hypothetical protein [Thermoanaerobaculia bacterium]
MKSGFFQLIRTRAKRAKGCIKIERRGQVRILQAKKRGVADGRSRLRSFSLLLFVLAPLACRLDADRKVAERILDRYRKAATAKPLPASYVIRMRLLPEIPGAGTGVAEVAWEPNRFRERVSSAGVTTERGIQGGKAYFTDEDGFTRVASEPVVRELLSRWYFWRRAWLFADRARARVGLGSADAAFVSVRLEPPGANPLLLSFSRRDGTLLAVHSPRFDVDFAGERAFRERSGLRPAVRAEIAWAGLPMEEIADAVVGGERGRFAASAGLVPIEPTPGGGISFPARVSGIPLRLSLDAVVDGPLVISRQKAAMLSLPFTTDVYGRAIGAGAALEIGGFSASGIHVEAADAVPAGSDGVIGGTLFREAVVELDPKARGLGIHDPARWVFPAGFNRMLVDDDGDRPVATVRRKSADVRLLVGSRTEGPDLRLAPAAASRLEIGLPGEVTGLRWGILALPPLSAAAETRPASPEWGHDGRLGFGFLLKFHAYLDMPHRWIYLRAVESPRI